MDFIQKGFIGKKKFLSEVQVSDIADYIATAMIQANGPIDF